MKKILQMITSRILVLALIAVFVFPTQITHAAAITTASDLLSSEKISTLSNHRVRFITPTGVTSGQTVKVTFATAFSMGTFALANVDLAISSSTACSSFTDATLAAAPTGTDWGVAQSGSIITFTAPTPAVAVAAGRCIEIEIGSNATTGGTGATQITNPSSAASYVIAIGGSQADSGNITVPIITDDQVQISANVDQTLTFSISDNSIGFGTLTSANARYATGDSNGTTSETGAHDLAAATNAASGYAITVNGATLTSGSNTIDAIGGTNTASSAGTEQFGVRYDASGGTGTVTAPYDASGFAFTAGSATQIASATSSSATTTYSSRYIANISGITEPGAYSTTLTYNATANF